MLWTTGIRSDLGFQIIHLPSLESVSTPTPFGLPVTSVMPIPRSPPSLNRPENTQAHTVDDIPSAVELHPSDQGPVDDSRSTSPTPLSENMYMDSSIGIHENPVPSSGASPRVIDNTPDHPEMMSHLPSVSSSDQPPFFATMPLPQHLRPVYCTPKGAIQMI